MKEEAKKNENQTSNFHNPEAEDICNKLFEHMPSFLNRRKGAQFKAIIFSIAEVFREDRNKIRGMLPGVGTKVDIPTGPRVVIRGKDKVKKHAITTVNPDCPGCPGNAAYVTTQDKRMIAEKQKAGKPKAKELVFDLTENPFTSDEDILDRFESKSAAMKAFCQTQKIDLPNNVTKATTIAKYMMAYYDDLKSEEE